MKENSELLHHVLEQSPFMIFWKDVRGVYLGCNKNFAGRAGLDASGGIVGRKDAELSWSAEVLESIVKTDRQVIEQGCSIEAYEEQLFRKGEEESWAVLSKSPITDRQGVVIGIVGIYIDMTARKMREFQSAERLVDLERFKGIAFDREIRMVQLKKEVNALARELGRAPVYDLSFLQDTNGAA